YFFFSSRRRHTRFSRDWSSDVCSSDLNRNPSHQLFKKRFKFYDKIFLKVLKDENYKGEWIFQQFYDKNSAQTMFRFLDEESTFFEEIKIMQSLFSWSFIKAFYKTL